MTLEVLISDPFSDVLKSRQPASAKGLQFQLFATGCLSRAGNWQGPQIFFRLVPHAVI